jgi:cytochrome c-type biogenesis protein CcmH/NrfF
MPEPVDRRFRCADGRRHAQPGAQRIAAGEDPEAIRGWLVQRYGDYVSYAPRVTAATWPLFAVPRSCWVDRR